MTTDSTARTYGWRVYGAGIVALGVVGFALGDFLGGQSVPKAFPERTALAYAAAAFLLVAGAALEWRRTTVWAAAALTLYFGVVVVGVMDLRVAVAHWRLYLVYENLAEELAMTAGALIIWAERAKLDPVHAARLIRAGRLAFGLCAVIFGGAHFAYMQMTAPLVPKWLPPSQEFWGYATGVFHIAGGVAILTGVRARLAAILLAVMYGSWTPLVHIPLFFANPHNPMNWNENATNIVLTGVAWIVADSLPKRSRSD